MHTASNLRERYFTFAYSSYSWLHHNSELTLSFRYLIGEHQFTHKITVHNVSSETIETHKEYLDHYSFQIGLFESLSYWKLTASPVFDCQAGSLSIDQKMWWHKLIAKGMGEYFFVNDIDFTQENFLSISSSNQDVKTQNTPGYHLMLRNSPFLASQPNVTDHSDKLSLLIPIGGGKDSATAVGLLQNQTEIPLSALCINPTRAALDIAEIANLAVHRVTRTFDPLVFELNSQGYLNGHIPISSVIAAIGSLVGYLFDHTHVVLANESSANEGNIEYKGHQINHQYSKSFEFEKDFQTYSHENLPCAPVYFSLLRPLNELQIGQLFSTMTQFHQKFRSCNRGNKQNIWCCDCSKCLFAWTILYPFFKPEELTIIFGENLFEKDSLWPTLTALVRENEAKPFDCVGTKEETLVALFLALEKHQDNRLPILLEKAQKLIADEQNLETRSKEALKYWNKDHTVPQELLSILKSAPSTQDIK